MSRILTLGHSDRSFDEVLQLLRAHHAGALIDVRRFPASRLIIAGVEVEHLISGTCAKPAALSEHARVHGGQLIYPPPG